MWCDLTMQKMYKLDVPVLCTSAILIPLNLCISFSVFRLPWERPCLAQNWISPLRNFSMVWRNQVIKECAEYAIIYFCVLHFKKLDEKSSCVGFIVFYVFERKNRSLNPLFKCSYVPTLHVPRFSALWIFYFFKFCRCFYV